MKIISGVRIAGFRSIADVALNDLGDHTIVIGKNSSGKSNVLRALNLFFNGEPSPGNPMEFSRDLHYRPTRRQKKEIRIEIRFDLPETFNFRSGLERIKDLGNSFSVRKVWELDRSRNMKVQTDILVNEVVQDVDDQVARDFLSLIVFRYIPNRTVPADVLKDESQTIASAIFRKLKKGNQAADVLSGLSDSAERLLAKTADALSKSGASISKPNIATADSLGGMLRMSGFKAQGLNGASVRDEDWGAGHQSFFLLNVLREIDTDYSRQFGWKQACIWAVEEPESGLHHDLQTSLSRQLMEWASDAGRRLQIFTTTHSPVVAMSGDRGYWVDIDGTSSVLSPMNMPDLVRSAERHGVATYMHPVLTFPFNPVVLVEGFIDEQILNHVATILRTRILKFISLPNLDCDEGSGVDTMISYIKKNSALIHKRPNEAPFIVLVDWDVSDQQLRKLEVAYGADSNRYVIRPPLSSSTDVLDKSFRGIEKFYPKAVIRAAHDVGDITVAFPSDSSKQWSVSKEEFDRSKTQLMHRVLKLQDPSLLGALPKLVKLAYEASTSIASEQLSLIS